MFIITLNTFVDTFYNCRNKGGHAVYFANSKQKMCKKIRRALLASLAVQFCGSAVIANFSAIYWPIFSVLFTGKE